MLTNRINVTYNIENIDADFDIFRVEKANKDYYKYNILDSAVYEFKAAAVQWTFGATALVLFRKGEVTEKQFKESIMKEYEDVKIQKIDLFDSEQCNKCFYFENRLLAQLLINSMRTPKHEAFMYNNLTGKLFYHDPSWRHKDKLTGKVNFIRFLEIVVDPGMYLNLEHKTFKRYDRESNGLYVIDSKTGEFRKKLKTDTNVITYKEGSLPHNHFRVDNFDISDITHFRKSKMGVMEQFLRDVNDNLSKYMSIEIVEREDAQAITIEDTPFLTTDNGKLNVSLKEGKKSCQAYVIKNLNTRINLYYNRTFVPTDFRTTKYEGSYSRPFRPDYTLAIFPCRYQGGYDGGESKAIKDGAVSYIHFDAKYRITELTSFVGKVDNATDFDDSELEDEKASEVTNTYKRGDLLKMHTYNDAIRRTIGSYVLYPGNAKQADMGNKVFSLYDEILPGVGAFAIKPSNSALGEKELCRFISDMIKEKGQDNSRLNRLKYYAEMVMQEPAAFKNTQVDSSDGLAKALCVIGYIRSERPSDYYHSLEQNDLLKPGKEFLFYYYAIKGNTVYSHHHDIAKAGTFRFYKNNIDITKTYDLEPILCDIVSSNLVSKQELVNQLNSQGFLTFVDNHNADFYYVIKVKVVKDCLPRESKNISDINGINGNDSFSPHSPKVIDIRAFLASP